MWARYLVHRWHRPTTGQLLGRTSSCTFKTGKVLKGQAESIAPAAFASASAAGFVDNVFSTNPRRLGIASWMNAIHGGVYYATCIAMVSAAAVAAHSEAEPNAVLNEIDDNKPMINLRGLVLLYEEIEVNLSMLCKKLLLDLEKEIQQEKAGTTPRISPELRAMEMSHRFENLLERVQDAVFRNNHVSKADVEQALRNLKQEEEPSSPSTSTHNQHTKESDAEKLAFYVSQIQRLRWKCTGSREVLFQKAIRNDDSESSSNILSRQELFGLLEEIFPRLNQTMERIVQSVGEESHLRAAERDIKIAQLYLEASGQLTEAICAERKIEPMQLQQTLHHFHADAQYQEILQALVDEQQKWFKKLGLL